jgi:hypothetical protein
MLDGDAEQAGVDAFDREYERRLATMHAAKTNRTDVDACAAQEAEDKAAYRHELLLRDACESVEAEETGWAVAFGQQPSWWGDCHYASGPG